MSLVQYSSSDESDMEDIVNHESILQKTTGSSISSFLPPPKNRAPAPIPKARVLGSGIKQRVSSEIAENQDGIVLPRSSRAVTSFVPSSLRSKTKNIDEKSAQSKPTLQGPSIQVFQQVKSSRPKLSDEGKFTLQPVVQPLKRRLEEVDEPTMEQISEGEPVKEFNINEFYQNNLEMKERGELVENRRLHTVTNNRNQLTSLMKNAAQDEELLKEKFERNKKARKERGERYGW